LENILANPTIVASVQCSGVAVVYKAEVRSWILHSDGTRMYRIKLDWIPMY